MYSVMPVLSNAVIIVPRLFEEKRRDIVFGFLKFRPSVPLKEYVPYLRNSPFFRHFDNENEWAVGILCAQLLLQFLSESVETLQMS